MNRNFFRPFWVIISLIFYSQAFGSDRFDLTTQRTHQSLNTPRICSGFTPPSFSQEEKTLPTSLRFGQIIPGSTVHSGTLSQTELALKFSTNFSTDTQAQLSLRQKTNEENIAKVQTMFVQLGTGTQDMQPMEMGPTIKRLILPQILKNSTQATKNVVQKGAKNPKVQEAITKGQKEHKDFTKKAENKGLAANKAIPDTRLRPDAITKQGHPVELKPNTPSGRKAGEKQLKKYEDALDKKGRVVYYDPKPTT